MITSFNGVKKLGYYYCDSLIFLDFVHCHEVNGDYALELQYRSHSRSYMSMFFTQQRVGDFLFFCI